MIKSNYKFLHSKLPNCKFGEAGIGKLTEEQFKELMGGEFTPYCRICKFGRTDRINFKTTIKIRNKIIALQFHLKK